MGCSDVLVELTNNFMKYSDTTLHIFRNSGKDYNDYGRYEDCTDIHNFNYFLATVLHKFPIPFTLGICLPAQCSLTDLDDFKPILINVVNAMIPNMFEEIKGFSNQTHIHEQELLFVEPLKENARATSFSVGAFFVSVMITIFAFLVTTSTFVIMKRRKIAL
jgi:hypothetical protein